MLYLYKNKGFVCYVNIGTEGLRGCIRVSEGTDVGLRKARSQRVTVPRDFSVRVGRGGLEGGWDRQAQIYTPLGACSSEQLSAAQTFKLLENYRAAQLQLKICSELRLSCNVQLKGSLQLKCSSSCS